MNLCPYEKMAGKTGDHAYVSSASACEEAMDVMEPEVCQRAKITESLDANTMAMKGVK